MEVLGQISVAAPFSGSVTKQMPRAASALGRQDRRVSPARQMSTRVGDAKQLAEDLEVDLNKGDISLRFTVYDKDKIAVKVVDKQSGDIIREIPPEELQELSVRMDEMRGRLLDQIA